MLAASIMLGALHLSVLVCLFSGVSHMLMLCKRSLQTR